MSAAYRADNVGSFLRPADLLEARRNAAAGGESRLKALEDKHIERVLAKQKEIGFDVFTDGELRRRNFMSDFTDAVEGFDMGDAIARAWNEEDDGKQARPTVAQVASVTGIVKAKLRQARPLTGHELPYLKAHCPGKSKMTLPSATQFPAIAFKRGVSEVAYRDPSALLWDIVEIMKKDMAELAAGGVSYIQIDA